jgi:hypothetical protein
MATLNDITTGEQAVTAAGAVTGSLNTSAFTEFFSVKLLVRGLAAGKRALFSIEDTANVTPYSDVRQIAVAHFIGAQPTEGVAKDWAIYDIPMVRWGVANSALRVNCLAIDATPGSVYVHGWLEN